MQNRLNPEGLRKQPSTPATTRQPPLPHMAAASRTARIGARSGALITGGATGIALVGPRAPAVRRRVLLGQRQQRQREQCRHGEFVHCRLPDGILNPVRSSLRARILPGHRTITHSCRLCQPIRSCPTVRRSKQSLPQASLLLSSKPAQRLPCSAWLSCAKSTQPARLSTFEQLDRWSESDAKVQKLAGGEIEFDRIAIDARILNRVA